MWPLISFDPHVALPTGVSRRTFTTSTRNLQQGAPHVPRSPVETEAGHHTGEVPDYTKYYKKATEAANKSFSYFAVGTMGLISAYGAKALVSDFLQNMSASADVLALAKVEVEMGAIPEGKNVIIKVGCARFFVWMQKLIVS